MSPIHSGHIHSRLMDFPIGAITMFLTDLGPGPIEFGGRVWYKADGTNGTHNLIGVFPRFTNAPTTTGGSDIHTLTKAELPTHSHKYYMVSAGAGIAAGSAGVNTLVSSENGAADGLQGQPHNNMPSYFELIPYEAVA